LDEDTFAHRHRMQNKKNCERLLNSFYTIKEEQRLKEQAMEENG